MTSFLSSGSHSRPRIGSLRSIFIAALILVVLISISTGTALAASTASTTATQAPGSPYPDEGFPGAVAWSPVANSGYLAVGDSTGNIQLFDQNSITGDLTQDQNSPIAAPGRGQTPLVAWDSTGRYLILATQSFNELEVVDADNAFAQTATSPVMIGGASGSIQEIATDPTADLVAVLDSNAETVTTYSIDPSSGALTQDSSQPIAGGQQNELSWSPSGDLLAVSTAPAGNFSFVNGMPSLTYGPSSIATYSVNPTTGSLTPDTTTTGDLVGVNSLSFSADGSMLAAGNNSNTVDLFSVVDSTGSLTPAPASPLTLPDPASQLAWSGTSDDLATTDQSDSSGQIDEYSVDPLTGATELAGFPITDGVTADQPFALSFQPGAPSGYLAVGESNTNSQTGSVAAFQTIASSGGSGSGSTGSGSTGSGSTGSGSTGSGSTGSGSTTATTSSSAPTSSTTAAPDPTSSTSPPASTSPGVVAPAPVLAPVIAPNILHTNGDTVTLIFTPLGGFFGSHHSILRPGGRSELRKIWPVLRDQFAKATNTRITVVITANGPSVRAGRARAAAVRKSLLPRHARQLTVITKGQVRAHNSQINIKLTPTTR